MVAKKIIFKVLGWILILQAFGFGTKIITGFLCLCEGMPGRFLVYIVFMFLDFFELLASPVGWLRLLLFGLGIWLVVRKYGV